MQTYKDVKAAQDELIDLSAQYEEQMYEDGGEVTEVSENLERQKDAVSDLLAGEGIDTLGRIIKGKEDYIKTLKAEKDSISRKIKATESSIEFFKSVITDILHQTGRDKAKGLLYGFTATTSNTTKVDMELLNGRYLEVAEQAIRAAGVPDYVTVKLDAKVSLVPEGEDLPDLFEEVHKDTVRFTKPRAAKE